MANLYDGIDTFPRVEWKQDLEPIFDHSTEGEWWYRSDIDSFYYFMNGRWYPFGSAPLPPSVIDPDTEETSQTPTTPPDPISGEPDPSPSEPVTLPPEPNPLPSEPSYDPAATDRGVFGGGDGLDHKSINIIDYVTISTTGNATDFGDLRQKTEHLAATSNGVSDRGIFSGGSNDTSTRVYYTDIDYITISSTGNSVNLSDLLAYRSFHGSTSNGSNDRAVFISGNWKGSIRKSIEYKTISTDSDALEFGRMRFNSYQISATSNGVNERGIFYGVWHCLFYLFKKDNINYITISTPSNSSVFGSLTELNRHGAAISNGTNDRAVFGGGSYTLTSRLSNVMEYVTISTRSDSSDFGDLTISRRLISATSNATNERGVFGGGDMGGSEGAGINNIDYITISTIGNATDFGDLTYPRDDLSATSNSLL